MSKTGRTCTVCASPHRAQCDLGIVHRVPARVLAVRFGLSRDAIHRHAKAHLSPVQRAALLAHAKPQPIDLEALRTSESEGLFSQLVAQRARLQGHAEMAAELGDIRAAVSAETAIQGNLTLVAKLVGQLAVHYKVTHTNLLVSPAYLQLRQAVIAALAPFPDAGRAVAAALYKLESDAAADITAAAGKGREPLLIEHEPMPAAVREIGPPPC